MPKSLLNVISRYFERGDPPYSLTKHPKQMGILGKVIRDKKSYWVNNSSTNTFYNQKVDINTELPLITSPVFDSLELNVRPKSQ